MFVLSIVTFCFIVGHRCKCRMGRKKYNLCTKCGFRHAAPMGKACTACAAGDGAHLSDDKSVSSGQGPNQGRLDVLEHSQNGQNAVSIVGRVNKIEQDMGAMNEKLDLIIASMKKPDLPESEGEDIIGEWTKDILEAWDEVKTRGRAREGVVGVGVGIGVGVGVATGR